MRTLPNFTDYMELTNPNYAYMFGFIQGDGHLQASDRNRGRLQVELSECDAELLLKFQELTPYPSHISYRTRKTNFSASHTSVTWALHAYHARQKLITLGLPAGRKSDIIKPPTVEYSLRDYMRGVIDADGSVGMTAGGFPFISLVNRSKAIIDLFTQTGFELTGKQLNPKPTKRDNCYNPVFTREDATIYANWLYQPGDLCLERKMAKSLEVSQWIRLDSMPKRSTLKVENLL